MTIKGAWSQSVTVGGEPARVRDLQIRESATNRVPVVGFTVEALPDNQAAFDACEIGAVVSVSQTADGETITNDAEVVAVSDERGSTWTQRHVRAKGLEFRAKTIRIFRQWSGERADTIVTEAWTEYAAHLGYALDIDDNAQRLDVSLAFDSLHDLMEQVCRRTAWAWRIESGTVRFFDPLSAASPGLSQGAQEVRGDTLRVDTSADQLVNVARSQAFIYRTQRLTVETTSFQCRSAANGASVVPEEGGQWEIAGDPVVVEDFGELVEREAKWKGDDWIEFDPVIRPLEDTADPPAPGDSVSVTVEVTHRLRVWVVVQDQDSIAEFGSREGQPILGDGGMTEAEAAQMLGEHLARYSQPTVQVRCDALRFGYRPDSLCVTQLTDPAIGASLYVTEVTRSTQGGELSVDLRLASPVTVLQDDQGQRPSSAEIDPIPEMVRRIERLERFDAHPQSTLGFTTDEIGGVGSSPGSESGTGWAVEWGALPSIEMEGGAVWASETAAVPGGVIASESVVILSSAQEVAAINSGAGWGASTSEAMAADSSQSAGSGWGATIGAEQQAESSGSPAEVGGSEVGSTEVG